MGSVQAPHTNERSIIGNLRNMHDRARHQSDALRCPGPPDFGNPGGRRARSIRHRDLVSEGMNMERKRINSSNIRSVGYDPRNRLLEVEFSNGNIYQYNGVSDEVQRRFLSSTSAGSYFRDNIEENFSAKRIR